MAASLHAGGGLSDELGPVFAALADPTRRGMVEALLRDGTTSVPALSAGLPISRQAVAKHLATLEQAGLLERLPASGREVRYGLRGEALARRRRLAREPRRLGSGGSAAASRRARRGSADGSSPTPRILRIGVGLSPSIRSVVKGSR